MEDQGKALEEALNVVKVQAFHMKRCLDNNKLMDALKHTSTMLSELRTSSLTPKNYYELYMAIFDELRHLTTYLYDAHMSKRHHLSDLYELVQYAGNIVPRLYLMITVGSVYMRVSKEIIPSTPGTPNPNMPLPKVNGFKGEDGTDTTLPEGAGPNSKTMDDDDTPPIKELMKDMLEMARGVQHPTRGLFLRYYLSGMTRDYLPDYTFDGPHGTIRDSIHFILQNFIEMNKLWVRLQHQGHSRERDRREQERKELRLLVGSNLVRLSQLDGLDLEMYKTSVLPNILEEIVSCKDTIAQEYLMEVIIQVFHDDFHLRTLENFLSATASLVRTVNVKQIVISLIDRFSNYAARARDDAESDAKEAGVNGEVKASSGIPDDVQLFEVFWGQITGLVTTRPEFTVQDIVALLVSLCNLSLNCYPERLDNVDKVLGFAKERLLEAQKNNAPELNNVQTISSLLQLLLAPLSAYHNNILTMLSFPSSSTQCIDLDERAQRSLGGDYIDLLNMQPFSSRRQIAHTAAQALLRAHSLSAYRVESIDGVNLVLGELCSVMIRDQIDGGLFGPSKTPIPGRIQGEELPLDWEDVAEEQNLVVRLCHMLKSKDGNPDSDFQLLATARNHFGEGGDVRLRFTVPGLLVELIKLARKFKTMSSLDDPSQPVMKLESHFRFIAATITGLFTAKDYYGEDAEVSIFRDEVASASTQRSTIGAGLLSVSEVALRLNLQAAQASDECGLEDAAQGFLTEAFGIYEQYVSDSKSQLVAIRLLAGTMQKITHLADDARETLSVKMMVSAARLIRRSEQCRAMLAVSHIFYTDAVAEGTSKKSDAERILECITRALKIAEALSDGGVKAELLVEVLEKMLWFFEKKVSTITPKAITDLVESAQTAITLLSRSHSTNKPVFAVAYAPPNTPGKPSSHVFEGPDAATLLASQQVVNKHYQNVLSYVRLKKGLGAQGGWGEIHIVQQHSSEDDE
ncbi:hypothetical protein SmJEL517_g02033 [Synchytrium microbalum]|uniref:Vacuolar protein sorting-associated protein 35 n=1 Tax=Synchytrium microbalum TaxID=1806994 RepID=A0A507C8P8_9FUNG|nr:uncharacterized protein SmJEL517_g02033 [Synchytrium microbalum]TPX35519.1 hypothetical protein SmJEL517_g02033 [Synchytrium microbalum]